MRNKVVLVTGGSGLLGREIVAHLRSKGALAINADLGLETDINAGRLLCDVTNPESIERAFDELMSACGRLDGIVNNAYPRTPDWGNEFEKVSFDSWNRNLEMQLGSVFNLAQTALRYMERGASIVNIGSIYGVVANDFNLYRATGITAPAAYSAIKGGVISFSRYLASYVAARGIRVNCVSPGGIFNHQDPAFVKNYEGRVPMGRMGSPADIAPAVGFLLSDDSSYITGQNLVIDGGWTTI